MSNDAKLLVAGLYAYDNVLTHAATTFEGYDIFDVYTEPGYRLVWECIRDTWKNTEVKPTKYTLLEQVKILLNGTDLLTRARAEGQVTSAMNTIINIEEPIAREHTQVLLEAAGRRAAVDKLLQVHTLEDNSTGALIEHVDGISAVLGSVTPKRGVRKRPLEKKERTRLLRMTTRWKWGIDYWDTAGLRWYKKEIHGLLGPSGGGKTTNMTNIATRQLKEGRKVLIALYEQPLEEDVEQRILSNLSGVKMDELRDKNEDEFSPAAAAKIDAACELYVDNLVVLDMIGEKAGNGGVAELKAHIAEEKRATGFEPDLIIVDWLGEMVQRYDLLGPSDAAYRRTCEKFMTEMVQYKEDTGYSFLILHQTNTHAQSLSCAAVPNKTMSHEFRSFSNRCDSCSVLGTMNKSQQICWFIPDKSRRSATNDRKVKLNGDYMRFEDVTNEYEVSNNTFVKISAVVAEREAAAQVIRNTQEEGYLGA